MSVPGLTPQPLHKDWISVWNRFFINVFELRDGFYHLQIHLQIFPQQMSKSNRFGRQERGRIDMDWCWQGGAAVSMWQ